VPGNHLLKLQFRNLLHSLLLIAGMLLLLSALGWFLMGIPGVALLAALGVVAVIIGRRVSPRLIVRMYGGRPLGEGQAPILYQIVNELSERAGLSRPPRLCYLPSQMINSFTVGSRRESLIVLTDGLLRSLNAREIQNVLAHEIAHVKNNDLRVMGLADFVSRMTIWLSVAGQFLLVLNLPLIFASGYSIPWMAIAVLIVAPAGSTLLQLALSRTREFDADLDAVRITRDPQGLAAALTKLERLQASFLDHIFFPGRRNPEPSLLRTHPATEDRVRRLLDLEKEIGEQKPEPVVPVEQLLEYDSPVVTRQAPRWHKSGLWH
jgi:heat shock protein HtpX